MKMYTLGDIIREASERAPEDYHEFNIDIDVYSNTIESCTVSEFDVEFNVETGQMIIVVTV